MARLQQPKRLYPGKSAVAQQKPRDAHGHFTSAAAQQRQYQARDEQKWANILGTRSNQPQQQSNNQQQPQPNNDEEKIKNLIGIKRRGI